MKSNKKIQILLLSLAALASAACGAVRRTSPSVTDSTRVEVRTETVTLHDTAYVELPVIVERIATLDTTSTLENIYAKSEATVTAGILHHSLETKAVKVPVEVKTQIVYRDSLVYRDRVETRTVEVERQLTWWQKAKMKMGIAFLVLTVIAILLLILRFYNPFNLKRL
ncbi:MAG: hypothetical protein IJQ61_09375 [Bacteroidales bacterium]|nr:hypothetical protein [Bacteroidales bacterium]MBR0246670.1 hypothetical protein [Bacteroidales bacterium]